MGAGEVTVSGAYLISDTENIKNHLNAMTNLNTGSFNFLVDSNKNVWVFSVEGA